MQKLGKLKIIRDRKYFVFIFQKCVRIDVKYTFGIHINNVKMSTQYPAGVIPQKSNL